MIRSSSFLKKLFRETTYKMGLILLSRIISTLLGIILLPVYIRYLGVESYGLIAFYTTLSTALSLLDMGLSVSANREIAIMDARGDSATRKASLLFSIEVVNWGIAIFAAGNIVLFSSYISENWINVRQLDFIQVKNSVILMAAIFACQFPSSVYDGVINGMQRQGQYAAINLLSSVLKNVGAIFILEYISSTVQAYFVWQLATQFLLTIVLRTYSYKVVNPNRAVRYFSVSLLRGIKRFAIGMTAASIIAFFIQQVDKIVVSKFLYLEYVGYYNIAFLVAGTISLIASPIVSVIMPKFNRLQAQSKFEEFNKLYFQSSKWLIAIVSPLSCIIVTFAHDILFFWTGNEKLADETTPILQVVALGAFINSITSMFYFYTLGKGNVKYGVYQNLIAAIIIAPSVVILTKRYGAFGAGCCWLLYNFLVLVISLPIFHKLYLKGKLRYWFKDIFLGPVVLSVGVFWGLKCIKREIFPAPSLAVLLLFVVIGTVSFFLILKDTRVYLLNIVHRKLHTPGLRK